MVPHEPNQRLEGKPIKDFFGGGRPDGGRHGEDVVFVEEGGVGAGFEEGADGEFCGERGGARVERVERARVREGKGRERKKYGEEISNPLPIASPKPHPTLLQTNLSSCSRSRPRSRPCSQ